MYKFVLTPIEITSAETKVFEDLKFFNASSKHDEHIRPSLNVRLAQQLSHIPDQALPEGDIFIYGKGLEIYIDRKVHALTHKELLGKVFKSNHPVVCTYKGETKEVTSTSHFTDGKDGFIWVINIKD